MLFSTVILATWLAGTPAGTPEKAPLQCDIGPVKRSFGGNPWLVYSCDDQTSMVIISDTGNSAMPFYFFLSKTDKAYKISGEGNGDRKASDAAGDEISRLSEAELARLLAETKAR